MKRHLAILVFSALVQSAVPVMADDEKLLVLDVEIYVDEERVSTPRVALEPGSDASIQQGLEDDLALKIVFHSTHIQERGAGILTDIDFGLRDPGHLQAQHVVMPWNEAHEVVFSTSLDGPSIRLRVTPSQVARSELMLWPEKPGDD